ncbi:hypothetical protein ACFL0V_02655 [Nanoarchaeota archaeon]
MQIRETALLGPREKIFQEVDQFYAQGRPRLENTLSRVYSLPQAAQKLSDPSIYGFFNVYDPNASEKKNRRTMKNFSSHMWHSSGWRFFFEQLDPGMKAAVKYQPVVLYSPHETEFADLNVDELLEDEKSSRGRKIMQEIITTRNQENRRYQSVKDCLETITDDDWETIRDLSDGTVEKAFSPTTDHSRIIRYDEENQMNLGWHIYRLITDKGKVPLVAAIPEARIIGERPLDSMERMIQSTDNFSKAVQKSKLAKYLGIGFYSAMILGAAAAGIYIADVAPDRSGSFWLIELAMLTAALGCGVQIGALAKDIKDINTFKEKETAKTPNSTTNQ